MAILAAGSSQQELGYSISLITINTLGVIINFMVVIMFLRFRHRLLRKNKNLLLFSMSIADLLVGMTGIIGGVLFHLYATGRATVTMYKICGLLPLFGSFFISILSLGIMTADRLVSIKFPVKYTVVMNRRKVIMLIFTSWAVVTSVIVMLGVLFFTVSKSIELATRAYLLGTFFVIGSIILSVSNAYLFRTLQRIARRRSMRVNSQTAALDSLSTDQVQDEIESNGTKKKMTRAHESNKYEAADVKTDKPYDVNHTEISCVRFEGIDASTNVNTLQQKTPIQMKPVDKGNSMICIWMTVLFIICWFPAAVYYVIWAITGSAPAERAVLAFCLCLASSNSLINPIIYFAKRKDFRDYLLRTFGIQLKRAESESSFSSR